MAMNYTTLIGAKGVVGSIMSWVNYARLDALTVVDEAQTLLYSLLRTREMRTQMVFQMLANNARLALPARFLDPIGDMRFISLNSYAKHRDQNTVEGRRTYTENTGTLGTNPFTTTNSSLSVSVALTGHNFTQESVFSTTGATAFNNVTINGTFPITSITDANNFVIDITTLGATPNASGSGGGASVAYTVDVLVPGTPGMWAVWDEAIHFEQAFFQTTNCKLNYYQSLPLLSASNLTNFLTSRYPQLMRRACVAAAADFMKDNEEFQKHLTLLQGMVERTDVENDMELRGADLYTETP